MYSTKTISPYPQCGYFWWSQRPGYEGFVSSTLLPPSPLLLLGAGSDVEAFCSNRSNSRTKVPVEVFTSTHFALLKRIWKCQIFSNQSGTNQWDPTVSEETSIPGTRDPEQNRYSFSGDSGNCWSAISPPFQYNKLLLKQLFCSAADWRLFTKPMFFRS